MKEFDHILANANIKQTTKDSLKHLSAYYMTRQDPRLVSRTVLLYGRPGTGKTFLGSALSRILNKEVVYMAFQDFKFGKSQRHTCWQNLLKAVNNSKKQIVFLDDLNGLLRKKGGEVVYEDKQEFLKLVELVRSNPNKVLIATTNNMYELDENMIDRIEIKGEMCVPDINSKKEFLKKSYKGILDKELIEFAAEESIGYNYRDLQEAIRMAYRFNRRGFSKESIAKAFRIHRPAELYGYKIIDKIKINLKDVIGKKEAIKAANRLILLNKNRELKKGLGLRYANTFLFHGPPGTGKTFMAQAIAGQLGVPLINIKGEDIYGIGNPITCLQEVMEISKMYKNCIVFIDEAEKRLGNQRMEEDNPLAAEFHAEIDGANSKELETIFILAANDITRFSDTLKDRFVKVKFDLPNLEERKIFFKKKLKNAKKHLKHKIDTDYLAKNTEGLSYREFERVWNELIFRFLETNQAITTETIDEALREVKKEKTREEVYG
jgi:AAA+ superfamily predicted ATPase